MPKFGGSLAKVSGEQREDEEEILLRGGDWVSKNFVFFLFSYLKSI